MLDFVSDFGNRAENIAYSWLEIMDLDNIECVSSSNRVEGAEIQNFGPKPRTNTGMPPATSVHELLECPVCTGSMYPPIHQVLIYYLNS